MNGNNENKNPAVWEFEADHPDDAALLRDALRAVTDPELGYNVIELGLIRNVQLKDEKLLLITMILTTPFCPYAPQMIEEVRNIAERTLNLSTSIDFRMDPWDESMMEDGFELNWGRF